MNRSSSFSLSTAFLAVFILALSISFVFSGQKTDAAVCANITRVMYRGATDRSTGGQVTRLQQFLKDQGYFAFSVSGYFGPATEGALKQFQRRHALVSSGNPATTGYGATGPKTRAKINSIARCAPASSSSSGTPIAHNTTPPSTQTTPPNQNNTQTATNALPAGASISCTPSTTRIGLNSTVTWNSSVSGFTNPTYRWEGSDGLLGNFSTVQKTYTQYGVKRATLTINNRYSAECATLTVDANLPAYNQTQTTTVPNQTTTPPPPPGVSWPVAGLTTAPIYAVGVDNIQYTYLKKWYWLVDGNSMRNMPEALALVNLMPPGFRFFSSLNAHNIMNTHPDDRCQVPGSGNPPTYTNFQCPWYDNAIANIKANFTTFANLFKNAGGQIDYLVLDSEQYFPNWVIGSVAHGQAIEQDPRFPALLAQIQSTYGTLPGNSSTIVSDTLAAGRWGPFASPSSAADNYLKWNSFMMSRFADQVNEAIFNPIRDQFPGLKGSDYEMYYHSQSYQVPDGNGHRIHAYGSGKIVGTHQAKPLYGSLSQISTQPGRQPVPGQPYPATPFNALKIDMNSMRAMRLSSSAPISPWFSVKSWTGAPEILVPTSYTNNDYYTENILHASVMSKEQDFFILWNRGVVGTTADDQFFESTLQEANTVLGYSGRQPILSSGLVPWDATVVYSGTQVGGYKIWRFTPELSGGQTIDNVTTSSGTTTLTQSVTFNAGGRVVTFPNAFIYKPTNPVSRTGAWIIQRGDASAPTIALNTQNRSTLFAAVATAIDSHTDTLYKIITRPFTAGFWKMTDWFGQHVYGRGGI